MAYAKALYLKDCPTLDEAREAVTTLEDTVQIARRVFGGAHPMVRSIESQLRKAQAVLTVCDTS